MDSSFGIICEQMEIFLFIIILLKLIHINSIVIYDHHIKNKILNIFLKGKILNIKFIVV